MRHASIYNRFVRWSRMSVLARIFAGLTAEAGIPEQLMIDSTHLKAHRGQPGNKGGNTLPQCLTKNISHDINVLRVFSWPSREVTTDKVV
jgi:hypothetical protein